MFEHGSDGEEMKMKTQKGGQVRRESQDRSVCEYGNEKEM